MNAQEFDRRVDQCVEGLMPVLLRLADEHGHVIVTSGLCACLEESVHVYVRRGLCTSEHVRQMAGRLLRAAGN